MEKIGFIEIKINGFNGNLALTPENYDIQEIIVILKNAENFLFSDGKREKRPTISYKIEEGSVRHIFKTSIQFVISFNAIIGQVDKLQNIDFLETPMAEAFENIQNIASRKNYAFTISTSIEKTNEVHLDRTTQFFRTKEVWADAEFYFYGKITDVGGKTKANIHIATEESGILVIETPILFLKNYKENLLYKTFVVRTTGRQNSETGEIDTSSLKFVELVDYQPKYDEKYLNGLRNKAKKSWLHKINPDTWLKELRENYET
ncbi:hypothetical protein IT568_05735 [bacterium]|nr:hypothetical protein [bacterium]